MPLVFRPQSLRTPAPRVAVSTFFTIAGFISANWIARIPAVSSKLDLSTATLGTLLLFIGIGSLVAFQFVGRLIERYGSARTCVTCAVVYVLSLSLLALSPVPAALGAALFVYGFSFGALDVAMNAQGVEVERRRKRPIMGSLHGFFSLGALLGASVSGFMAQLGVGLIPHFVTFSAIALAIVVWANRGQIEDAPHPSQQAQVKPKRFSLPPRALWPLGAIAFCGAIGEGGMADWSALYIHNELGGGEGAAAFGFAAFSTTMLIGRFAGDWIVRHVGAANMIRYGTAAGAAGLLAGTLIGNVESAIVGFAIMGLGISGIFPIIYSAAGSVPGIPSGRGVAAVATIGYTGFLAGPPFLGWLAQVTSLQASLVVIDLLLVCILPLTGTLRRGNGPHHPDSLAPEVEAARTAL